MSTPNRWLMIGAILSGLSVAAGAFGAHGLDRYFHQKYENEVYVKNVTIDGEARVVSRLSLAQKYLADFKTGAEYQMYHGLALLAVGLLARIRPSRGLTIAGVSFVLGCLGFSGGLYAYTLTGATWFGMTIVPAGGVCFLIGWVALAWAVSRRSEP
jgi:uncharacterized membrane protein YgdD (TMEM256/DUF423 family)